MSYFVPGGALGASQQFGIQQTDVFAVDENGTLNVSWVVAAGPWQGPSTIGPKGITKPGAYVAAGQQIGANQTDVFLIDNNGQLNVFWVDNAGAWNGPGKIGPAGLANPGSFLATSQQIGLNQTDVFLVDKNGQLNVFWVAGQGAWNGPGKIGTANFAEPGSFLAATQQFGLNQTDVLLVDKTGQLSVFWVSGGGAWNGPGKIGPAGVAGPGSFVAASAQFLPAMNQTDVFLFDKNGLFNIFWVIGSNPWQGPAVRADPVQAPSAGLGSNSNYVLDQNCSSILGLSVSLHVTEDLIWQSSSGGTYEGLSLQLNAFSPANETCAFQQFVITLYGTELVSVINNYYYDSRLNKLIQLFLNPVPLTSLPSIKIPAGYVLTITLQNDGIGNITGANFVVIDAQGNTAANVTQTSLDFSGVTSADLAPIVAFELDIVGPGGGESTVFSSGVGYIVYSAPKALTVLNSQPTCTQVTTNMGTLETSNSFYGPLSATPSIMFTQGFWVSSTPQMIKKVARLMHAFPLRP